MTQSLLATNYKIGAVSLEFGNTTPAIVRQSAILLDQPAKTFTEGDITLGGNTSALKVSYPVERSLKGILFFIR